MKEIPLSPALPPVKSPPRLPSVSITAPDVFSNREEPAGLSIKTTPDVFSIRTTPADLSNNATRRSFACSPLLSRSDDSSHYRFNLQRSFDSYTTSKCTCLHSFTHRTEAPDTPSPIQSPPIFPSSSLHYQFIPTFCSLSLLFTIRSVKRVGSSNAEVLRVVVAHMQWCPSTTTLWEVLHKLDALEFGADCYSTVLKLVRKATTQLRYHVGFDVACKW